MKLILKSITIFLVLLFLASNSYAQTATPPAAGMDMDLYMKILFFILFILLNAVFIPLLRSPDKSEAEGELALEQKPSPIQIIKDKLSGLQPMEKERSLILEGDYDGIEELDNNVPPWFNILFYGTIIIAVIYFLNFHVFGTGKLPLQEYQEEVNLANMQRDELIRTGAYINENTVVLLTDNESIKNGRQLFTTNCVTCHGEAGQGIIGPNLTDQYWIHGGGIKNVFTTIKYGVPAKGMITWMNQMNPKLMQQVASYVVSLQGTNPPGGKAPEGNIYKDTGDSVKSGADSIKTTTDTTKKDILNKELMKSDSVKAKK
jgi:cytochrome c oxidase cbb3-type subunit 3